MYKVFIEHERQWIMKLNFIELIIGCGSLLHVTHLLGRRVDTLDQAFRFHNRQSWYCRP